MGRIVRRGARLSGLAVVVVLSGCFWPMPGGGPDRQGHNELEAQISVETAPGLAQVWEATVDDGPVGDPVVSIGGVHVDDDHSLYTFNHATGARRWVHTEDVTGVEQPYVWKGYVLAGRSESLYIAPDEPMLVLDARTGEPAAELGMGTTRLHALRGDMAALESWGSFCSPFSCFSFPHLGISNRSTGEGRVTGIPYSMSQMTLGSDWFFTGGVGSDFPFTGPALRGYSMVAPAGAGCGVNVEVCPKWELIRSEATPVLSDDELTVYAGGDSVIAVDAVTGAVLWQGETAGTRMSTPALAGDVLLVADTAPAPGRLLAFPAGGCGAATCAPLWSAPLGAAPMGDLQPAVAGGVVFVAEAGGALEAFDAAGCGASTCEPLWSASVGSYITGAPAVSHGRVYVGTGDGRLVAFGLPD